MRKIDSNHPFYNEEFKERLARNQFLEWAFVHNNYYGTLEEFIDHRIIEGIDVVMDIDVQGARKVMKKREDAIFIFIAPPGLDTNVLRQRLEGRNTEDIEQINQRIATAEAELKAVFEYRYLIINNTIDEAVKDLKAVIRAARCQSRLYEDSF
ncbi:MAG: guanylate kinase, partial [Vulcanimicrobiota bacterium]